MNTTLLVTVFALAIAIGTVIAIYNQLISMIEAVNNNNKQIDIQLDRRYKVFESLINVVKKYMDYENHLKEVLALRQNAQQAKQQAITRRACKRRQNIPNRRWLNVMVEQYPDLKASNNVQQLQESIVSTEIN